MFFSSSLSRLILALMLLPRACTAWTAFGTQGSRFVLSSIGGKKKTSMGATHPPTVTIPEKEIVRGIWGSLIIYSYSLVVVE